MLQINATSMAPITAVQFGANRLYEEAFVKLKGALQSDTVADGPHYRPQLHQGISSS